VADRLIDVRPFRDEQILKVVFCATARKTTFLMQDPAAAIIGVVPNAITLNRSGS